MRVSIWCLRRTLFTSDGDVMSPCSNAKFARSIQGKPKIEVHEPVLKAVERCIVRSNVPFADSSNERRVQIVEHGKAVEQLS